MSERESSMGQEQEPLTGTAALEARRTQMIEAGELQEPDIAGAEAVELGSQAEYQEAKQVEQTWVDRAEIASIQPLFEGIQDKVEQRRILLEFMGQ